MADLLEQASAWLDEMRDQHLSRRVIYQRGADLVEVSATIGRTVFETDDGLGAALRFESRDFLIPAADLVLAGKRTLPQRGDRIQELQDGVRFIYELMAPGSSGGGSGGSSGASGGQVWRFIDPYRRTLRIHTKQVDQEAAS